MMGSRPFWRPGARMLAGALFVLLVCSASVAFAAPVAKGTLRAIQGAQGSDRGGRIGAATAGIDEEIPGTELPLESRTTTFSGDLAAGIDEDDVHQVFLYAGEVVTVDLTADPTTDYGLYIYGPWAGSIWLDEPLASAPPYYSGGPDAYPLELTFKVPETGPYYLNACTWTDDPEDGGTGPYDLTVTIERAATGLMLFQQPTLSYAATATIAGMVYSPRFEDELPAGDVLVSISLNGFNYMPLAEQSTDEGGFYFTWVWPMKADYQVQFEGTAIDSPSAESMTVNMRASLARPRLPATAHGHTCCPGL